MSKFIAVESIDGAGGTTVADALADEFADTTSTREPWGSDARHALVNRADEMTPMEQVYTFCADRARHQPFIEKLLSNDINVIGDRYLGSTVAYQSYQVASNRSWMWTKAIDYIDGLHDGWCRRPDVTVWIDVPPMHVAERLDGDIYETPRAQRHADTAYWLYYDGTDGVIRADGRQSKDEMVADVIEQVGEYL